MELRVPASSSSEKAIDMEIDGLLYIRHIMGRAGSHPVPSLTLSHDPASFSLIVFWLFAFGLLCIFLFGMFFYMSSYFVLAQSSTQRR